MPAEGLAVVTAAGEAHGNLGPGHEPVGQARAVGAVGPGVGEGSFHAGAGADIFQGAENLASGPGRENIQLLTDVDQGGLLIRHGISADLCSSGVFCSATPSDGIGPNHLIY